MKNPWAKAALMLVAVVSVLYLGFCLCFFLGMARFFRGSRGELTTTEQIKQATGLSFPDNTRVLGGSYLLTPTKLDLVGKVAIPTPDAVKFFKRSGFKPLQPYRADYGMQPFSAEEEMKKRGWHLGNPQNTLTTETVSPDEIQGQVYCTLDISDPKTTVVYIFRSF